MINDSTQYIARISYGKDSLKMLDVIKSRGLPLDRITTTDVWATDTIPANLPPMMAFKDCMDQRIWELYRIEVEHLCAVNKDGSKKTYEQMFYHVPVRRSQSGQVEREKRFRDGSITGFPVLGHPWCQGALKRRNIGNALYRQQGTITGFPPNTRYNWCQKLKIYQDGIQRIPIGNGDHVVSETQDTGKRAFLDERPARRKDRNIVEYLGIAADEPKRFGQLNDRKRAPLVEFGIDEDLCGLYCQYADMLSPTYETSCRDGCWFCHNQGVDQLRLLRRNYPDYWALLMKWDLDSPISFKADGHTVHDFDQRFQMEDAGLIPTGRTFRWAMLDKPPPFVGWKSEQISIF